MSIFHVEAVDGSAAGVVKHLSPQRELSGLEVNDEYSFEDVKGKRHTVRIHLDTQCGTNDIDTMIDEVREDFSEPDDRDVLPGDVAAHVWFAVDVEIDGTHFGSDIWYYDGSSSAGTQWGWAPGWVVGEDGCGLKGAEEAINSISNGGEPDDEWSDEMEQFQNELFAAADEILNKTIRPIRRRMTQRRFPMREA